MLRRLSVAGVAMLGLASCEKIKDMATLNIDLPYSTTVSAPDIDTTVAFPPEGLSVSWPLQSVATNSQAVIDEYKIDAGKVTEVTLKSFSQKIVGGQEKNFNFVDTIQVYASAKGLPEILVAHNNNIPDDVDSISLTLTEANLKPYLMSDTVYLRAYGHVNKLPKATDYKLDMKANMKTSVLEKSQN